MYPDWELNQQPFGLQAHTQSTEPHHPGLFGWFMLPSLPSKSLISSSASYTLVFIPCNIFFISVIVFFISDCFFIFLISIFMFPISFSKFSYESLEPVFKTLHLVDYLSSCCLVSFLEFCSVFSFEAYFFVSSFWLPSSICFHVLSGAFTSPGLNRVALCSRWLKSSMGLMQ